MWILFAVALVGAVLVARKLWREAREREADRRAMREIREKAARAREQPPIVDALGEFRCMGNYWQATVDARGTRLRIGNYDAAPEDLREALALRRAFLERALADDAPLRRAAAEKLLRLYNQTWREGREELDVEGMAGYLALRSIMVTPQRNWGPTVYLTAPSWMFGGHAIELALDAEERPKTAHPTDDRY